MAAYLVIEWLKNGQKELKPPQLEAVGSTKVIAPNGREEGKTVLMQFKSSLWEGTIISLHGKIFIASTQTRCDLINDGYKIKPTKPGSRTAK